MITRVLIIGGYGNFGQFITTALAKEKGLQLIVAGRNPEKGEKLIESIEALNKPEAVFINIQSGLGASLNRINPDIVIHTSGPYQAQGYMVAEACIEQGSHYIDLADAREFVSNIYQLDKLANSKNVLVCSGASSVPTLTSAIIDKYIPSFSSLEEVDYAITSAQRTNQGLATTRAILSYVGKPFKTLKDRATVNIYGWQGLRSRKFWGLNKRSLGNCNIPDLDIFPKRYPSLINIRFQAGIESKIQHIGLFMLSWLVRLKLINSLQFTAFYLLKVSRLFDSIGTNDSGFYMKLNGKGNDGKFKTVLFEIIARNGDGLYIPCIPAILMVKKLARSEITVTGAVPCIGFINLDEYLNAFEGLDIKWRVN